MFFSMQTEYGQIKQALPIFSFHGQDTAVEHQLFQLSDEEKNPLFYYADIQTPVCIDNICKPVFIEIYWNLLGNYIGYGVFEDHLLTKYDHDLFEPEDYEKLHNLLLDKHSILERRKLSNLFDSNLEPGKQIEYKGQKVDGISGATRSEIKESVVAGGLFSCYTLWHLANGEVSQKLATLLDRDYTPAMSLYLLHTDYSDYHAVAIKRMNRDQLLQEFDRIIEIFPQATAVTKTYLLKKLPASVWAKKERARALYQLFDDCGVNSKTILIDHLEGADSVAYEILVGKIADMTKNHLKTYLSALSKSSQNADPGISSELDKIVTDGKYRFSYLIEEYLKKVRKG